jgi:hypothetical protein
MKQLRSLFFLMLAVSLSSGCGSSSGSAKGTQGSTVTEAGKGRFAVVDSASLKTGIAAEVRQRPTKPIENEDDIPWGPLAGATVVVEDKSNTVLGKVQSDANGKFYLELEPGTHYLRAQRFPGKMFPIPLPSQRVYVSEGEIVHVVIEYDTGIR